ncbi:ROK family protein [Paenibacillus sp. 1P07SE]|uniref:ROK family transcriptional regulator n=1 Tax=Paenibacillus sp. 1P07SE TaxID=3132209 RepID=UPI0039A53C48
MKESNGNPQLIRSINERRILQLILGQPTLSRAEISRLTGLSKPTVSAAVKSLLELGLIEEIGQGSAGAGRKPTLVRFAAASHHVLGVQLGADRLRLVLANLQADRILEASCSIDSLPGSPSELLPSIRSEADRLLARAGTRWDQIGCAAFAIPGVVGPRGEVSMLAPHLQGCEPALARTSLAEHFPCPVTADNDVNLAALAEYAVHRGHEDDVFAFLFLDSGIGAGIMTGGRLLRGLGGAAGELGDMRLADGRRLEDRLSEQALLDRARTSLQPSGPSQLGQPGSLTLDGLFAAVAAGDPQARQALAGYAEELAGAVHNLTALLAPQRIVLGGRIGEQQALLHAVRPLLDERLSVSPQLDAASLGSESVLTGALQSAARATMTHIEESL